MTDIHSHSGCVVGPVAAVRSPVVSARSAHPVLPRCVRLVGLVGTELGTRARELWGYTGNDKSLKATLDT